jgi:hypothetical protein
MSPSECWPTTWGTLKLYTEAANEKSLPNLYIRLAKAAKTETQALIQDMMLARSCEAEAYSKQVVVVTKSLATMIGDFEQLAVWIICLTDCIPL